MPEIEEYEKFMKEVLPVFNELYEFYDLVKGSLTDHYDFEEEILPRNEVRMLMIKGISVDIKNELIDTEFLSKFVLDVMREKFGVGDEDSSTEGS